MKTYTITFNEEQFRTVKDALVLSAWMSYKLGLKFEVERKRDIYHYMELFSE